MNGTLTIPVNLLTRTTTIWTTKWTGSIPVSVALPFCFSVGHLTNHSTPLLSLRVLGWTMWWREDEISVAITKQSAELEAVENRVDALVNTLRATPASEIQRSNIVKTVSKVLENHLPGVFCFTTGSYPLKTYLPDSDVDLSIFPSSVFDDPDEYLVRVCGALCGAAISSQSGSQSQVPTLVGPAVSSESFCTIRSVTFVNARVKIIKCVVDNTTVDISINQIGALAGVTFLEESNRILSSNSLFKRSLLLIKAWCLYESTKYVDEPLLGASNSSLSSYALSIMVLALFTRFNVKGVLHALVLFFETYAVFEWESCAVTLGGPVRLGDLMNRPSLAFPTSLAPDAPHEETRRIAALLSQLQQNITPPFSSPDGPAAPPLVSPPPSRPPSPQPTPSHSPATSPTTAQPRLFSSRCCNIVDPLDPSNNLGRSVSRQRLACLRVALQAGRAELHKLVGSLLRSTSLTAAACSPFSPPLSNTTSPLPPLPPLPPVPPPEDLQPPARVAISEAGRETASLRLPTSPPRAPAPAPAAPAGSVLSQPRSQGIPGMGRAVPGSWHPHACGGSWVGRASATGKPMARTACSPAPVDILNAFLDRSWQMYGLGDGWRPDLMKHPLQRRSSVYVPPSHPPSRVAGGATGEGGGFGGDVLSGDAMTMWGSLGMARRRLHQRHLQTQRECEHGSMHVPPPATPDRHSSGNVSDGDGSSTTADVRSASAASSEDGSRDFESIRRSTSATSSTAGEDDGSVLSPEGLAIPSSCSFSTASTTSTSSSLSTDHVHELTGGDGPERTSKTASTSSCSCSCSCKRLLSSPSSSVMPLHDPETDSCSRELDGFEGLDGDCASAMPAIGSPTSASTSTSTSTSASTSASTSTSTSTSASTSASASSSASTSTSTSTSASTSASASSLTSTSSVAPELGEGTIAATAQDASTTFTTTKEISVTLPARTGGEEGVAVEGVADPEVEVEVAAVAATAAMATDKAGASKMPHRVEQRPTKTRNDTVTGLAATAITKQGQRAGGSSAAEVRSGPRTVPPVERGGGGARRRRSRGAGLRSQRQAQVSVPHTQQLQPCVEEQQQQSQRKAKGNKDMKSEQESRGGQTQVWPNHMLIGVAVGVGSTLAALALLFYVCAYTTTGHQHFDIASYLVMWTGSRDSSGHDLAPATVEVLEGHPEPEESGERGNLGDKYIDFDSALTQWLRIGDPFFLSFNASAMYEGGDEDEGADDLFQWMKDGEPISGAATTSYHVASISEADAGIYSCVVTRDGEHMLRSAESVLKISVPPSIQKQVVRRQIPRGGPITFSAVAAAGAPAPQYQWKLNGNNVAGATSPKLHIASAEPQDAGTYTCMLWNVAGSVEWEEALLLVASKRN